MNEKTLDRIKVPGGAGEKPIFEHDRDLNFIKNIGRKIKESRRRLNLTQDEFAKKCGTSIQLVQYWESGHNLTLKTLMRISRSLNCGVAALMEKPDGVSPAKRGRPPGFSGK